MRDLKINRKRRGWTQNQLAEEAELSNITISQIELGNVAPKAEVRRKIEKALGERVDWLTTRGLRTNIPNKATSWELVEQNFRGALYMINSLQRDEIEEFFEVAQHYLDMYRVEIKHKLEIDRIRSKKRR